MSTAEVGRRDDPTLGRRYDPTFKVAIPRFHTTPLALSKIDGLCHLHDALRLVRVQAIMFSFIKWSH